jgi:3-oxoacyl-[acyl-carrier protein] reductase
MSETSKVILISGGSRGLGCAIANDLLRAGHRVATFSRSSTDFVQEQTNADPDGDRFVWRGLDGCDFDGVRQFVREVEERFGSIEVLINNAGVGVDGMLSTMRDDDVHAGVNLNLEAALQLTRTCLKSMLRQQAGCIINVTSVNGIRGFSGVSVYSATKAALDGLTRSLAREVGPMGIRVNSIAPGYFESAMTEGLTERQKAWIVRQTALRRLGKAEDMLGVVRFLISDEAAFITGQTMVVDGGLTC